MKRIYHRRVRIVILTLVVFLGLHNTGDHAYQIDGPESAGVEPWEEESQERFDIGSLNQDLVLEPDDTAYTTIPIDEKIMATIKRKAEEDWPASDIMRDFQIEQQKKALQFLESVEAFPEIEARARNRYPDDFEARKFYYLRQVEAFENLEALTGEWLPFKEAYEEQSEEDYEIIWHAIRQQMGAKVFLETNGWRHQEILSKVAEDNPDDYILQLEAFILQLKAKEFMAAEADSPAKDLAKEEFPKDYHKQKIYYLDQMY